MVVLVTDVVDGVDAGLEEDHVAGWVDLDVVDVMDVQGLLAAVERCLEGTEEVTNPNDVDHCVDDDHHSSDEVVDVHLVHDALLSLDVGLFLDVYLDNLFALDDEFQPPILDDCLDLPGQHDALYLLYDDTFVDDVYVVDVKLVLLTLDDLVFLDDGDSVVDHNVVLFLYHDVDVLDDDDYSHSYCRCQSPAC